MAGSTLILVPRFNEAAVMTAIAEHKETIMDGVPTAYYYLLAHPDFEKYDLSSLTRCWGGGRRYRRRNRPSSPNGPAARCTRYGA